MAQTTPALHEIGDVVNGRRWNGAQWVQTPPSVAVDHTPRATSVTISRPQVPATQPAAHTETAAPPTVHPFSLPASTPGDTPPCHQSPVAAAQQAHEQAVAAHADPNTTSTERARASLAALTAERVAQEQAQQQPPLVSVPVEPSRKGVARTVVIRSAAGVVVALALGAATPFAIGALASDAEEPGSLDEALPAATPLEAGDGVIDASREAFAVSPAQNPMGGGDIVVRAGDVVSVEGALLSITDIQASDTADAHGVGGYITLTGTPGQMRQYAPTMIGVQCADGTAHLGSSFPLAGYERDDMLHRTVVPQGQTVHGAFGLNAYRTTPCAITQVTYHPYGDAHRVVVTP